MGTYIPQPEQRRPRPASRRQYVSRQSAAHPSPSPSVMPCLGVVSSASAFAAPIALPLQKPARRATRPFRPRASAAAARAPRATHAEPPGGDLNAGETAVVLMRHGLTDWNCEGRVQGGLDKSRLTAVGARQARVAGACVRHISFDGVYVSPLSRARSTLEIARQASQNESLLHARPETLASLLEIQVPWQGLLKTDIEQSFCGDAYMRYLRDPTRFAFNGFSPVQDLMRRARKTWNTLRRRRGRCFLVVAHNQINRALLCDALGLRASLSLFRQINCCFNVVLLAPDGTSRIRLINSTEGYTPTTHYTPRTGYVRFVLLCEGGKRGLATVLPSGEPRRRCRQVVMLGAGTGADLEMLDGDGGLPRRRVGIAEDVHGEELYDRCVEIAEQAREFADGTVVVCAREGRLLSALLTVLVGVRETGMDSFIFDAGGVTVVDVDAGQCAGEARAFVECHNVGAFAKEMGPVFGYARTQQAV